MCAVLAGATYVVNCQHENAIALSHWRSVRVAAAIRKRTTSSFGGGMKRNNEENAELAAACMEDGRAEAQLLANASIGSATPGPGAPTSTGRTRGRSFRVRACFGMSPSSCARGRARTMLVGT